MTTNKYNSRRTGNWVEWKHISMGFIHCPTCLRLDKCWFAEATMPQMPQHENCHCSTIPKPNPIIQMQATAESAYSKFDPYLFNTDGTRTHGKEIMLRSWGYTAADALWLKNEIERQGLQRYKEGSYTLHKLDHNGQRINIIVTIPRKDKQGEVSFTTGWVVYPNGRILLATPYGDK